MGAPPRTPPDADRRQIADGSLGGAAAGGNVLIAGDAGGAINPFNGEGIAYGYETGRLAAAAVGPRADR